MPAPPVLEFDPEGNLVKAWGGPAPGHDWPESNHGISVDNKKVIATLHTGSWPTVEGVLRWNSIGEPQGSDLLVEWINGKLYPVYPSNVALHKPVVPKPAWGG